jgi:hypothetical protein
MSEAIYSVWVDNVCYGKGMILQTATIFAKALFDYYWEDSTMRVTIQREKINIYEREVD